MVLLINATFKFFVGSIQLFPKELLRVLANYTNLTGHYFLITGSTRTRRFRILLQIYSSMKASSMH
jgi:hypothetical protein